MTDWRKGPESSVPVNVAAKHNLLCGQGNSPLPALSDQVFFP
jgi:hypothetical protein